MRHKLRPTFIAIFASFLLFTGNVAQAETLNITFPTGLKELFKYEFSVIELALANSDSDMSLKVTELDGLTGSRLAEMLKTGQTDVIFGGYSPQRNDDLLQVNIPMTRGMLGHRVFMTHRDNLATLSQVTTLAQLKQFCIGAGSDWPDADIMEQNGFCVDRAPRNRLWEMLENKRFPILTRAAHEAYRELPGLQQKYPDLVLVPDISLVYKFDFFIYVRKGNTQLQQLLTNGLERAYASGAFMENFANAPSLSAALTNLAKMRHVFTIKNPILDPATKKIAAKYWQADIELDTPNSHPSCPDDAIPCPEQEGFIPGPADDPSRSYMLATKSPHDPVISRTDTQNPQKLQMKIFRFGYGNCLFRSRNRSCLDQLESQKDWTFSCV